MHDTQQPRPEYATPWVDLPGADPEKASFVRTLLGEAREREDWTRTQQRRMVRAMLNLGKPIARPSRPKRKASRPTAHVRRMAAVRRVSTR